MRILTVTNLYPPDVIGGYELGCRQMVGALRRRGHEVRVLTSMPRWPVPDEPGVERHLRLTDYHTRLRRPGSAPQLERAMDVQAQIIDAGNVGVLTRQLDEYEPDLVYLWNITQVGGFGLAAALAHRQTPVVWHLMDAVPRQIAILGDTVVKSAARLLSRRMRARFIVCSQRLADEVASAGFEFGDRMTLVPNWVDPVGQGRRRALWPDGTGMLRLVSAGQLAPHKGFDVMVEAACRLVDSGRVAFRMDFFGAGLEDHYHRLILGQRLDRHVRLRGALAHSDLVERYWDYDAFLFPTWQREPFGFAPLEAAARGCVPIVSRDCGYAEWTVDGVHVLKVDPDPDALMMVLARILDQRIDLRPLADRARRVAATSFTLDAAAAAVERELERARGMPAAQPGRPQETYHLARLAERLAHDWAEAR